MTTEAEMSALLEGAEWREGIVTVHRTLGRWWVRCGVGAVTMAKSARRAAFYVNRLLRASRTPPTCEHAPDTGEVTGCDACALSRLY